MIRRNAHEILVCCQVFLYITCSTSDGTSNTCDSPLIAGLNGTLLSASSEYDPTHNASAAKTISDGWIAAETDKYQYLRVYFKDVMEVNKLQIQGSTNGWYSRNFRVSYSLDGLVWTPYNSHLSKDRLGELFERKGTVTTIDLIPVLKTRYLAINPSSFYRRPALRVEVYGCKYLTSTTADGTHVPDIIDIDTTWIPSQSPIVIDEFVVIRPSVTLTIEAGVSVIFTAKKSGIDIWGTLISNGILDLDVLLTSDNPVIAAHSKWRGVVQRAGGNISTKNTVVRQAVTGIQGNGSSLSIVDSGIHSCLNGIRVCGGSVQNATNAAVTANSEDVILMHTSIHDNVDGLVVHGTSYEPNIIIGHSEFDRNEENGINVLNWELSEFEIATNLFIVSSSFSRNSAGVKTNELISSRFVIVNSSFIGNKKSGFHYYSWTWRKQTGLTVSIDISNSQFFENDRYGIYAHLFYSGSDTHSLQRISITNTLFSNERYAIDIDYRVEYIKGNASIKIDNNTFTSNSYDLDFRYTLKGHLNVSAENNSFSNSRFPMKIVSQNLKNSSVSIKGNIFTRCYSKSGSDKAIQTKGITAHVLYNSFLNCSLSSLVVFLDGTQHTFAFNSLSNTNVSTYYVTVEHEYEQTDHVIIDSNYWGISDMDLVKSKVYDFFADSTKAMTKLNVYFPTKDMENATASPHVDTFSVVWDEVNNVTYVGGIIQTDFDFSDIGSSELSVNRSILIQENVDVKIVGMRITLMNKKGLKVYGSLTIGEIDGKETSLLLEGIMSYSNKWNGISLHSAELNMYNLAIQGTDTFVEIKGNGAAIRFYNCFSTDNEITHLVNANTDGGQLSLIIENSTIRTSSTVLYLRYHLTNLNVTILNSHLESKVDVLNVQETNQHENHTHVKLYISNSSLSAIANYWYRLMHIEGCSTYVTSFITSSEFSAGGNSDGLSFIKSTSIDITLVGNSFGESEDSIMFDFCGEITRNASKIANITGNVFNSSVSGNYITLDEAQAEDQNHMFYITNNTFDGRNISSRTGIYSRSFSRVSRHILHVDSNIFTNIKESAVYISSGSSRVSINNNLFKNNGRCLSVHGYGTFKPVDGLEISRNTFLNNTDTFGIVYLDRDEFGHKIVNITDNQFVENTGDVIALKCPDIRIKHNFFENQNALYNIRVISNNFKHENVVNASLNYWGTTSVREIMKWIYDSNYDESLLHVEFRPYLGSKNISDVQNADATFITEDGEVGGDVNGNVTLLLENSPYTVISNIKVNENDTLTIEAGVEIRVRAGVGIYVQGRLHIHGKLELVVKLISEQTGEPWIGLQFDSIQASELSYMFINDTTDGIVFRGSAVHMKNVTSSYSRMSGISVYIQKMMESSDFHFDEVSLENNLEDGVFVSGDNMINAASVTISNCKIARNGKNGLMVSSDANVEIINCSIVGNSKGGLSIGQKGDSILYVNNSLFASNVIYAIEGVLSKGIVMDTCIIRNHTYGYYKYGRWYTREYIKLSRRIWYNEVTHIVYKNTHFQNNTADWIEITSTYADGDINVSFENNVFDDGRRVLFVRDSGGDYRMYVLMRNNTFERNSIKSNFEDSALLEFYFNEKTVYHVELIGNNFNRNAARACMTLSSQNGNMNTGDITFFENRFDHNNMSDSIIDFQGHMSAEVHWNIFLPHSPNFCTLNVPKFDISVVVNATHNYWGTRVAEDIIETICGFEKDMEKAIIWSFPYFEDQNLTSLVFVSEQTRHRTFGGEIESNTFIREADWATPIKIYRSIIIRENAGLYIQAGVKLHFAENRGIYVQGTLVMIGGESSEIVLDSETDTTYWYGIIINSTSNNDRQRNQIQKTTIRHTTHGIVAYNMNFEIKRSHVTTSLTNCLTLLPAKEVPAYFDFEFTVLEACQSQGIHGHTTGNTTFISAQIMNTWNGIFLTVASNKGDIYIDISKNVFLNVSENVLSVVSTSNDIKNDYGRRILRVEQNSAESSCGITVNASDYEEIIIRENDFTNTKCSTNNICFMQVITNYSEKSLRDMNFEISANQFKSVSDDCVVFLKDNSKPPMYGRFVYNTLLDNEAIDGVVRANARNWTISRNIFDNPASVFDIKTELKGPGAMNVTNNWWGNSNEEHVYTRIFDQRRDPDLLRFEVAPVLLDFLVDCTDVKNCSSNGKCISPNQCSCFSGWSGPSCAEFDCSDVNNCYGNGICIGPNVCSCNDGWSGSQCVIASCSKVSDCSGRGYCVRPNVCICSARFHGGPSCQPCPKCQHGTCSSETGLCECEDVNWTGYLCDQCSETYYGVNCIPLMKLLEILPNSGPETGGNTVHVWGHNFKESPNNTYKCRFGHNESEGKWIAWNHVICTAPMLREGTVSLEISPDGSEYTNDKLMYRYYSTCPLNSCGRNFSPSRGQCIFGTCSCFLPWTGDNCSIELVPPEIDVIDTEQTVTESEHYTLQLKLKRGEVPVRWYISNGPTGMTVDDGIGLVNWAKPLARPGPYHIDVRVSNIAGEVSVTWSLYVLASYTVQVQYIEPHGHFPLPVPVKVFGKIVPLNEDIGHPIPVNAIVTSTRTGLKTVLQAMTDPASPDNFMIKYYPRPDDAGLFSVVATHPGIPPDRTNVTGLTWTVLGMVCEPSVVTVDLKINQSGDVAEIANMSTLVNIGEGSVDNITSEIHGLSGAHVRRYGDIPTLKFHLTRLDVLGRVSFGLVISNAVPLRGTILIMFTTPQGTSAGLRVYVKLSVLKPNLSIDPPIIHENIERGTIKVIEVNITNTGEVAATEVTESIPADHRLSAISFSSESNLLNESKEDISIQPRESARFVFSVIIQDTEQIGEMSGTIYINSRLTSNPLPYTFVITSSKKINITFLIKDEYTFFASDSPLVSNAKVRLSNPRRGISETKYTTNETGYVMFEDIYEDQYSLYAEAEDHSSYAAVIVVTSDNTEQDIFLQRVAVRYTWTVEPTTVQDVYNIELNSTFETYVPMPVVTIEPAYIDTLPLEILNSSTIEFTITNHGLIRADNVRFSLPKTHPYLIFESEVDFIGNIAANTSIIVPVKTIARSREKRSPGGSVCFAFCLLYDFTCFGAQTRCVSVKITHGQSGRSCSYGFYGFLGGGSVRGSGSFVGYVSSTPISCDCMKTFIKSCVLAFIPGFGCPLAVHGIISMIEKGSDGFNLRDGVIGLIDIMVGCFSESAAERVPNRILKDLVKRNLPVIGHMYTAVRCIMDMEAACLQKRKRREISSEVINAVVMSAKPMENFLNMGNEIFGNVSVTLEREWYNAFKSGIGDNTELGVLLSRNESDNALNAMTEETNKHNVSVFLERYNTTAAAWSNGSLSQLENGGQVINLSHLAPMFRQFLNDMDNSKDRGYSSIFDEYEEAVTAYNKADQSAISGAGEHEGVCARVRIRITQELVLTREAFNARLEIENGESADLENIRVEIQVKETLGTIELLNDRFSIGKPKLIGISNVDGTGVLGRDLSGSAEWLIIPYSNAAPVDDTLFDIGGRLSYSVDGTDFSTVLLPDTITVKPNPSLLVQYFHEKYVRGDDALTPESEPIIPFTLAVMVTNDGYGVARALKITSGQPEIVENEKGLLITFKIIGAQLGKTPISPSLTVNFGDIASFETKTARWSMTSTLMGTFYNFSASFQNINPLGDPQLSLIDTLRYHELFHLVRIPDDDDEDDFLVNDFPDQEGIPEKIYNSANGTSTFDVSYINISDVHTQPLLGRSTKVYTEVNLTLFTNTSTWIYARVINSFTSSVSAVDEQLLSAVTQYGRELIVDKNVWQTTHIFDTFLVHLVDYVELDGRDNTKMVYTLTYGPRNLNPPKFNATSYNATISQKAVVGSEVMRIHAFDRDRDNIEFRLISSKQFTVRQVTRTTAVITVAGQLTLPGDVIVELIAEDDGVPSRSSSVNISISITGSEGSVNTTDKSSMTTQTSMKPPTSVTDEQTTSTAENGTNDVDDLESSNGFPTWIIPVLIAGIVLITLAIVSIVYVVRRGVCSDRENANTFELQ